MPKPPQPFHIPLDRRRFLKSLAIASAGFTLPGYLAEALTLTPRQTEGPYYPYKNIPLDKDNDLLHLTDHLTAATGIPTTVSGRVLDASGNPIKNALVELWHADTNGNYIYSNTAARNPAADANFQGFGQYLTASSGAYAFRTIKAGLYPGRTRHFHFGITLPGNARFTTQLYWAGESGNASDSVLNGIADATQRASVVRTFETVPGTTTGEQAATWDIVMGLTPIDPTYPGGGNFLARGELVAGPTGGNPRYALTIPAFTGFIYEIYRNPTLADASWAALPFALSATGAIDRNLYTPASSGSVTLYVEKKAEKDFYKVAFRAAS